MKYIQKMSSSSDRKKLRSKNDRNGTEFQAGVDGTSGASGLRTL